MGSTKPNQTAPDQESLIDMIITKEVELFIERYGKSFDKHRMELHLNSLLTISNRVLLERLRDGLPEKAFEDYPDTPEGNVMKHENRLYNAPIDKFTALLDKELSSGQGDPATPKTKIACGWCADMFQLHPDWHYCPWCGGSFVDNGYR